MKKTLKKIFEPLIMHGVVPGIFWCLIPFLAGWGISKMFTVGEVIINNVIITDINTVCGLICLLLGALLYLGYLFKKYK